ncbi:MAG: hypothetical protein U5K75_09515 [Ahrensia sp.]|nr:hypothetical protein [Ahrensia sp.]
MHISAAIEKNRIALLRMVFCWLAAAYSLNACGDKNKPLPRRLARWVDRQIVTAEKCIGYLLIALFYQSQFKRKNSAEFANAAHLFARSNQTITLRVLTINGVICRLKALQRTLHNLHSIARRIACQIAARARVHALRHDALSAGAIFVPMKNFTRKTLEAAPP